MASRFGVLATTHCKWPGSCLLPQWSQHQHLCKQTRGASGVGFQVVSLFGNRLRPQGNLLCGGPHFETNRNSKGHKSIHQVASGGSSGVPWHGDRFREGPTRGFPLGPSIFQRFRDKQPSKFLRGLFARQRFRLWQRCRRARSCGKS